MANVSNNVVDDSLADKTVLAVLRAWRPNLSWKAARALLAARRVTVNGTMCLDEARRLVAGDAVDVSDKPHPKSPKHEAICIRHLDAHLVVVEKPAGMLTERPLAEARLRKITSSQTPSLDELLPRVIDEYSGRRLRHEERSIFVVHRLDRDASGLLVFARTPEARDRLTRQFAERTPSRVYWAVVAGRLEAQTIRTHLMRDRGDGRRGSLEHAANARAANPQPTQLAITHVKPLASRRGRTLLECRLETGRTNQIRIHLAELGHPILGDVKYGPPANEQSSTRLALHAIELEFAHPQTGEPLRFQSECPREMSLP